MTKKLAFSVLDFDSVPFLFWGLMLGTFYRVVYTLLCKQCVQLLETITSLKTVRCYSGL